MVWDTASGCEVQDTDGRTYLDVTAAFGVAAAGHAHPEVVAAAQAQMARLPHAMGDVHPSAPKARLLETLSRLTWGRWNGGTAKGILCSAGFEAVEAALKTALLATGRREIWAFEGGYHGLGHGALNLTHRPEFREPFTRQLGGFGHFFPFPETREIADRLQIAMERRARKTLPAAILVEPIQARGGICEPLPGWLAALREFCNQHGILLILDEIYTGFGRTGQWFACEEEDVIPDLICLGKALTGGFPVSACLGAASLMDQAWPAASGEAIHTSTFLGNPVGCSMALAHLTVLRRERLPARARRLGRFLRSLLEALQPPAGLRYQVRGRGLMIGLEVQKDDGSPATAKVVQCMQALLRKGLIILPEGAHSHVLAWTPPLVITEDQLQASVSLVQETLLELQDSPC